MRWTTTAILSLLFLGAGCTADEIVVLNDNGGWCWYQDERVLVHGDRLIFSSVANRSGTDGETRRGNVQITTCDLRDGKLLGVSVLHEHLLDNDHATPALLLREDGRILAVYSKHGDDKLMRYRISERPGDATAWRPERQVTCEAPVTYSNLSRLSAENGGRGRVYNFYRGQDWNPNLVVSDDEGETWTTSASWSRSRAGPTSSTHPTASIAPLRHHGRAPARNKPTSIITASFGTARFIGPTAVSFADSPKVRLRRRK